MAPGVAASTTAVVPALIFQAEIVRDIRAGWGTIEPDPRTGRGRSRRRVRPERQFHQAGSQWQQARLVLGIALAPAGFGPFGGDLLVGNFSFDASAINAFD